MGKLTEEQKASIPVMKEQGMTIEAIANSLMVSQDTIVYHLYHDKYKEYYRGKHARQRAANPKLARTRSNDYFRRMVIGTIVDGKKVSLTGLSKRPHSVTCELCGKSPKKTDYHHWDNSNPNLGMWLCQRCHWFANWLELPAFLEVMEKYFNLKEAIAYSNIKKEETESDNREREI